MFLEPAKDDVGADSEISGASRALALSLGCAFNRMLGGNGGLEVFYNIALMRVRTTATCESISSVRLPRCKDSFAPFLARRDAHSIMR